MQSKGNARYHGSEWALYEATAPFAPT
jgi:hypothetical protein